jgi:hypothetical protein
MPRARKAGSGDSRRRTVRDRRDGHAKADGNAAHPDVEALNRAADHCQSAFAYCARSNIREPADLLCLVDCAEMCRTTADFILRQGTYVQQMRDLCMQQLCDAADTCKSYPDDEVLAACADTLHDAVDALSERDGDD